MPVRRRREVRLRSGNAAVEEPRLGGCLSFFSPARRTGPPCSGESRGSRHRAGWDLMSMSSEAIHTEGGRVTRRVRVRAPRAPHGMYSDTMR